MNSVDQLATAIHNLGARQLVVVTGAGISLASGIPTFRGSDPDAVWSKDVMEMGTNRFFMENPGESWAWYLSRFDNLSDKEPNDAHTALVELERWHTARGGRFLLVTQNVDTLHRKAGSERLVEVHGRSDEVRCSQFGCELAAPSGSMARVDLDLDTFRTDPSDANVPRCPKCGSLLRQHVLLFDEFYDEHETFQWQRVISGAAGVDLLLFVGTSFAVGVTDLFLRAAIERRVPTFSIDPGAADAPHPQVAWLKDKAEELLPRVNMKLQTSAES